MAIRNKLLSLDISDPAVHALRVSLIMWTLLAMNITGRVKTVKIMATKLQTILQGTPASRWKGANDIQAWILLTGYSCAEDSSDGWAWFVNQIKRIRTSLFPNAAYDDLSSDLENFQRGFFYHSPVQRERTDHLADLLSISWWDCDVIAD
jgi:hypothetical protein